MNFKKGFVYVFLSNLLSLLIGLFTGFILPKILSIDTYANIKLFQLYITYIGILHLGYVDGINLKYGGKDLEKTNKEDIISEFKTFKVYQLVVELLLIIISIILKNKILFFCSIVILPINIASYIRGLYQAIGKFKYYSRLTNINTLSIFIINLLLMFIIKSDNSDLFIILYILSYILYWIFIEIQLKRIIPKKNASIKPIYIFANIKEGFFLMIGNFCNVLFTSFDRIFVKTLIGMIEFAYYSFATSVENLLNVFINPISSVMYTYISRNKEKEKVIFVKKIVIVIFSFIIGSYFVVRPIIDIFLVKYKPAESILLILFVAQFFSIPVRCIHINIYKAKKQQKKYFRNMIIVILLSIVLNIILYLIYKDFKSFAIATMITNIIWFIIGEFTFKEYQLNLKQYIYMILVVISMILLNTNSNIVLSICIYYSILAVITIILMRDIIEYIKENIIIIKKHILNILKRKKA